MHDLQNIRENINESIGVIREYLGSEADYLLSFNRPRIKKDPLHLPGPDFVDRIFVDSDRPTGVLRNL